MDQLSTFINDAPPNDYPNYPNTYNYNDQSVSTFQPDGNEKKEEVEKEERVVKDDVYFMGVSLRGTDLTTAVGLFTAGIFVTYITIFIIQESVFKTSHFESGGLLVFFQFLSYALFGLIHRCFVPQSKRRAPLSFFFIIGFYAVAGTAASCYSLTLLNFPTWGNMQEKGVAHYKSEENEMVIYGYSFGALQILPYLLWTGELSAGIEFLRENPYVGGQIMANCVLGYFGILFVLGLVRISSALTTVIVTSCRKALTVVFSFILFAKPFSMLYVAGFSTFFVGVALNVYTKNSRQIDALIQQLLQKKKKLSFEACLGTPSTVKYV